MWSSSAHDITLYPTASHPLPFPFSYPSHFTAQASQALDLNAVHVNPARPWLFAVGGDDQFARVYDFRALRTRGNGGGDGQHPGETASAARGADAGGSDERRRRSTGGEHRAWFHSVECQPVGLGLWGGVVCWDVG